MTLLPGYLTRIVRHAPLALLAAWLAAPASAMASDQDPDSSDGPKTGDQEKRRTFPLYRGWFEEQGIELPRPFGAGLAAIYMDRAVEVDDVRVQFGDRPPESISDRSDFSVKNSTGLISARVDAWVLPFLNVYLMGGHTRSEALMRTIIRIPTPGPGGPIEEEIEVDQEASGPFVGAGLTGVVGFGNWFAMADANYGESDIDKFDGKLDVWLFSGRLGRVVQRDRYQVMYWGGAIYLDSSRTITISTDLPVLGRTVIDVDQRPANPLTWQLGASLTIDTRWHLLAEAGTNSDKDFIFVASAAYRF